MSSRLFNLEAILDAVSGDRTVMNQVIGLFMTSSRDDLNGIRAAIAAKNGGAVKAKAHHLKGSLLEIGASPAVSLALQMEKLGSTQQFAAAEALCQELEAAIAELIAALDQTEYRCPA